MAEWSGLLIESHMVEIVALPKGQSKLIINKLVSLIVETKDLDAWMLGYPSAFCFPYLTKDEQELLDNA
jgi:hypothetical protein